VKIFSKTKYDLKGCYLDISRTIIIGNSGSGKSWLAERLAKNNGGACIDLDSVNWLGSGYNRARERSEAIELTKAAASQERWVIEGIYGWLVDEVMSRATALIWLRLSEEECLTNIKSRGRRGNASEQSFADLLEWADTYRIRTGSSAFNAHQRIFDGFPGQKIILLNRDEVVALANS